MIIKQLTYHNKAWQWQLKPTEFTAGVNLLVGVSGTGKTRIMEAIADLQRIAMGKPLSGVTWDISFEINELDYRWQGEFSVADSPEIIQEVFVSPELVIDRNNTNRKLRSPAKSIIHLLKNDKMFAPIYNEFKQIAYNHWPKWSHEFILPSKNFPLQEFSTLDVIQSISQNNTLLKLWLVFEHKLPIFQQIESQFCDIFPSVEGVKLAKKGESIQFSIKEKGIDEWILGERVSAGMFKTLMFITDTYLFPKGSIILIDEFENSLGVNCIDIIGNVQHGLQYIITSHHPYIINNVPIPCWRIVTRKKNVVTVKSAEAYHLGRSKHEAFKQLLQLPEFEDGETRE